MDDTAEAIAYQNVSVILCTKKKYLTLFPKEIDEMLHGLISAEDEEEILKELDELTEKEV